MDTIISNSREETELFAEQFATTLKSGTVIGLYGDLGAGKTCWVRGVARGLKISARVHSPTFAIMNEYKGPNISLAHIDLYRLENAKQIQDTGLEEVLLNPKGITVVEWLDRWKNFMPHPPTKFIRIQIQILSESQRCFVLDKII